MFVHAFHDLHQKYGHLPSVLQEAVLRANSHLALQKSLTTSCRLVLADLVSRADKKDPARPIKVNLTKVADTVEISYKTVTRAINAMESLQLIQRVENKRNRSGRFGSSVIELSDQLRNLLGLPARQKESSSEVHILEKHFQEHVTSDRKAMGRVQDKADVVLPEELLELEEKGIDKYGICRLRGMATKYGHKLEDVWAVGKQYTKEMIKGRLFNYLKTMIMKADDYAGRAKQLARIVMQPKPEAMQKAVEQSHAAAEKKLQQAIAGKAMGRDAALKEIKVLLAKVPEAPVQEISEKKEAPTKGILAMLRKSKGLSIQSAAMGHKCPTVYINEFDLNLKDHRFLNSEQEKAKKGDTKRQAWETSQCQHDSVLTIKNDAQPFVSKPLI
jgi:molybdenum-dependent DNA-binding transcriptional regulator ModE